MKRMVLVLLLLPGLAGAQGLGDAARRERQKRQSVPQKSEPRVFDNQDLDEGKPPKKDGEKQDTSEAAPDTAESAASSADGGDAAEREAAVRILSAEREYAAARSRVDELEARVQQLKDKLNPMSPSFVFGAGAGMAAPGADMRVQEELQKAQGDLEDARQAVIEAKKAVDEARAAQSRAGQR